MYMGRFILGNSVPLLLRTVDGDNTPTEPLDCPQLVLWSGATAVERLEMPVIERRTQTGTFFLSLFLGPLYAVGSYLAEYRWVLPSGYIGSEQAHFEVTAGGHMDGEVVSMYYFDRPHSKYVVHQTERGTILPGKGPHLA